MKDGNAEAVTKGFFKDNCIKPLWSLTYDAYQEEMEVIWNLIGMDNTSSEWQ